MKQRYTLIISVVIFAILLCGCDFAKPNADVCIWPNDSSWNDTSTEQIEQQLWIGENLSIDNLTPIVRDVFTAKVVKRVGEIDDSDFSDIRNSYAIPVLYHVEIQMIISKQVITENQTIKVVHYEENDDNTDYFANPLETGKIYLFGGMAQPVENSVVLVDSGMILSEINSDNFVLTPKCSLSQKNLTGIDTISDFQYSVGMNSSKNPLETLPLPTAISSDYTVKKDGKEISLNSSTLTTEDYNSYLEVLREAVKVGSKEKLTKIEDNETLETK